MSDYFLAPALVQLRTETNAKFPDRDTASDGWIGDSSHAARASDHNPCWTCPGRSNGIVRAIDIDSNGDPGEVTDLVRAVLAAAIGDPRTWYVISNSKIYSRTYGWSPRIYTGSNPHDHHVHVSLNGANGVPGDPGNFDTDPWFDTKPPPPRVPVVSMAAIRDAAKHPRRATAPVQVRRVQQALSAYGFYRGRWDGIYGSRTRQAVKDYELFIRHQGNGLLDVLSATKLSAGRFRLVR